MTSSLTLRVFATVLLSVGVQAGEFAGDAAADPMELSRFRHPNTGVAQDSATLISRVERALSRYAAACATHDDKAMAEVFTGSATIAYASNRLGRFTAGDALVAEKCWAGEALQGPLLQESPLLIYPTSDPNDVLIQYAAVVGTGAAKHAAQDIALVEMAGERIAQIRDYMTRDDFEP